MNDGFGRRPTINPNTNYSREEAAKALGVDLRTLKQFVYAGYLRINRSSGRILIKGESILALLNRNLC
jgi:predicted site-specific integrase-resolvase